jgi:2-polyprenyl-3-methyl-5-hydroxy-6-metoxy-1,4-benzoquinol methylase
MEQINCINGCESNDEVVIKAQDILYDSHGEFTMVRCSKCGLHRTNPRPNAKNILDYYPKNYSPFIGTRLPPSLRKTSRFIIFSKLYRKLIDFKSHSLPTISKGKALEIGCASGSYMHKLKMLNWEVEGIEVDYDSALYAKQLGFHVQINSLEKAIISSNSYDLIVAWMVMEHVHEPLQVLKKLNLAAKDNSYFVFSVPNISCWQFKFFGKYWYPLQLPTHLFHYDKASITRLLKASGWEIEKCFYQRTIDDIFLSFALFLKSKGFMKLSDWIMKFIRKSLVLRIFNYPLSYLFSIIGQTGRMTIWAKKFSN